MWPGTIVRWHDESYIRDNNDISAVDNSPLFLTISSFDKGPENLRVVRDQEFYDLYGSTMSFEKHGQPAIQAGNIINNGGRLLVKRIVAEDATLANTILVASLTKKITATPAAEDETEDTYTKAQIASMLAKSEDGTDPEDNTDSGNNTENNSDSDNTSGSDKTDPNGTTVNINDNSGSDTVLGDPENTVSTYNDLPATADEGAIYTVETDWTDTENNIEYPAGQYQYTAENGWTAYTASDDDDDENQGGGTEGTGEGEGTGGEGTGEGGNDDPTDDPVTENKVATYNLLPTEDVEEGTIYTVENDWTDDDTNTEYAAGKYVYKEGAWVVYEESTDDPSGGDDPVTENKVATFNLLPDPSEVAEGTIYEVENVWVDEDTNTEYPAGKYIVSEGEWAIYDDSNTGDDPDPVDPDPTDPDPKDDPTEDEYEDDETHMTVDAKGELPETGSIKVYYFVQTVDNDYNTVWDQYYWGPDEETGVYGYILLGTITDRKNPLEMPEVEEDPNSGNGGDDPGTGGDDPSTGDDDPTEDEEDPNAQYTIETSAVIKWKALSVTGVKTFDEVKQFAVTLRKTGEVEQGKADEDGVVEFTVSEDYPITIVVDNGRGVSNKAVKFVPDYAASKDMANFFYTINVFEGTNLLEKTYATLNPDGYVGTSNYTINEETSKQIIFGSIDGVCEEFMAQYAELTGLDITLINNYDLVFARTNRNEEIDGMELDPESIDLNSSYGIGLENGTNGAFGDKPFGLKEWEEALVWTYYPDVSSNSYKDATRIAAMYDWEGSDAIFDLDDYKICACFDANYPDTVKHAIAQLATFREDFMFFRDMGLEANSYSAIKAKSNSFELKNKFIADYLTNYQIYDPVSRKKIRVTMMYDFAGQMVSHFVNGPFRPAAGIANNMVLENAIAGTVNYTPRITPTVNQKSLLEDARINYAIFQNDRCVVQSLYTSQDMYTQLSYANNVLGIQQVVRAVRIACPKHRYTFVSGSDFSSYAENVNKVLANFRGNFAQLDFEYVQDKLLASKKIFYATIKFRFNNWAQSEIFDIYALPDELD